MRQGEWRDSNPHIFQTVTDIDIPAMSDQAVEENVVELLSTTVASVAGVLA